MGLFAGIDADAERIVRGEAPRDADPDLVELAALMRELRSTYACPPEEAVGERQLAAIVAEAAVVSAGSAVAVGRDSAQTVTRKPPARRGRTRAFRLAAAGLATLLAATGLAIAGVKPPGPVNDLLERIGIGDGDAAKPAGGAPAAPPSATAPEAPASGRSDQARSGGPGRDGGEARGEDRPQGDAKGANQGEPAAPAGGEGPSGATGTINSTPGRATAEEARTESAPPQSPSRSGDHAPEATGPPAAPGPQGAVQGRKPRSEGNRDSGIGQAAEALDHGGNRR